MLTTTPKTFSGGQPYLHVVGSGAVSGDDARGLMTRISRGGEFEGYPLLAELQGKVDLDAEARKAFATLNSGANAARAVKVALVTASAPMRVMLNFIVRLSPQVNETKFFATADEALIWLERT